MLPRASTLVDSVRFHSKNDPDGTALIYLADGERDERHSSFRELEAAAEHVAASLLATVEPGDRAIIALPSGPSFVAAFLGSLMAGVIAVPLYTPRRNDRSRRFDTVIEDSRARVLITDADSLRRVGSEFERLSSQHRSLRTLVVDDLPQLGPMSLPDVQPDDVAFLQYTSGSTNAPKGVIVGHGSLMANERMISAAFGLGETSIAGSWLPLHHDMGLIGGLLQGLTLGRPVVLMRPNHFVSSPVRWLRMISDYGVTVSGAPSSAFAHCVRSISDDEITGLDLSRWTVAFSGAEPIDSRTLRAFGERFSAVGFDADAFLPCYGLAESTLLVSGSRRSPNRTESTRDGRTVVSCGPAAPGCSVAIVDPETGLDRAADEEGEIWVAGPHVAQGYWANAEASSATFDGTRPDDSTSWLRTGDLGYLSDGELFVTGRLKDILIVDGVNHHPHDLERTIADTEPGFDGQSSAAFSISAEGETRIVVVQEVDRAVLDRFDIAAAGKAARDTIAQSHHLDLAELVVVPQRTLPLTTSGKIRRSEIRERYLAGDLATIAVWRGRTADGDRPTTTAEVESWLRSAIAATAETSEEAVDLSRPLSTLGLDSIGALTLRHRAAEAFGVTLRFEELMSPAPARSLATRLTGGPERPTSEPAQGADPSALSAGQRALWFLQRLDPSDTSYNVAFPAAVRGSLEADALQTALSTVLERHDQLRSRFTTDDSGLPVREVRDVEHSLSWTEVQLPDDDLESSLRRLHTDASAPFDLGSGPLVRASVYRTPGDRCFLLLSTHHIVCDLASLDVILREVMGAYASLIHGEAEVALPETPPSDYGLFVARQLDFESSEEGSRQLDWWEEQLTGVGTVAVRPDDDTGRHPERETDAVPFIVDAALVDALRARSAVTATTVATLSMAAYFAVLHAVGGETDLVVGTPTTGREEADRHGVGYYVNTVPVRASVHEDLTMDELTGKVRRALHSALDHKDVPLASLSARVLGGSADRRALFQTAFTFERVHEREQLADFMFGIRAATLTMGDAVLESVPFHQQGGQFAVDLSVIDGGDGLSGVFHYRTGLFGRETIELWRDIYLGALWSIAEGRGIVADVVGPRRRAVLPAVRPAGGPCVLDVVERIAGEDPLRTAVVTDGVRTSYGALNAWANRLAAELRANGVGPDERVLVSCNRGAAAVAAVLGVIKSGGAYVPVDDRHPEQRVLTICAEADVTIAITDSSTASKLEGSTITVVQVEQFQDGPSVAGSARRELSDDRLAYVLYTSGSTGTPKGVMVDHRALNTALAGWRDCYDLTRPRVVLQQASLSFDVFTGDLLRSLGSGGCLVFASRDDILDPERLHRLIVREAVDFAEFVPAVFRVFMGHAREHGLPLHSLRTVLVGSDSWTMAEFDEFRAQLPAGTTLLNSYGATEATVDSAAYPGGSGTAAIAAVPIGRPLPGTALYVLSPRLHPLPAGRAGELYIGGATVARGYLGRADLTAERFLPDPFGAAGSRMYRTGDLVRMRQDGVLEFLGRDDQQIKVDGHRIEPGEVERAILDTGLATHAVAVAVPRGPRRALVAYVVQAHPQREWDSAALLVALRTRVPEYLVPAAIVAIDHIPLTWNNKVDRAALPAPEWSSAAADDDADGASTDAATPQEAAVAEAFARVLGVDRVGRDDSFFALGGDSIMCMQVVSRVRHEGYDVAASDVYGLQTVRAIATRLRSIALQEPHERPSGVLPLTPMQRWLLDQELPVPGHWNQAIRLEADADEFDLDAFERALTRVVEHHDAFRLRFLRGSDGWVQQFAESAGWAGLQSAADESLHSTLDLEAGPLTRAGLERRGSRVHVLWTAHHLIVDGVSWRVLVEDLAAVYCAERDGEPTQLPPSAVWLAPPQIQLPQAPAAAPTIPFDLQLGENRNNETADVTFGLSEFETDALSTAAIRGANAGLGDALVTAAARALHRMTGSTDVTVDVEGHGRFGDELQPDHSRAIGWFTSILPLTVHSHATAVDQLLSVKEWVRRDSATPSARARNGSDVSVNFLGQFDSILAANAPFAAIPVNEKSLRAPDAPRAYAVEIDAEVVNGRLRGQIGYSSGRYHAATMRRLGEAIESELGELTSDLAAQQHTAYSPSDFGGADLDQTQLDALLETLRGDGR
ncbi:amino acid adenylation domain-containing protein [Leifsonia shinshuensis]|uniref:non-ribosomal peptide synthetase n=1 Tax=Leifsonia shinshuensis TaxID=150026 RepID=UPI001F510511|nr:non-ribosomal peptide synthetase [Leifsonia shinshuensis]MCI0158116.1 amino acid adenylation domain-containing protein [Leifsonia shinshuensis]